MDKTFCLIPVRGGSKRFPNKNKMLLGSAIDKAVSCKYIDEVWVSTDSKELAEIARNYNVQVIMRPDHLATDKATTEDVIMHFTYSVMYDHLILFECTFPLTTANDVNAFVEKYKYLREKSGYDSLISLKRTKDFVWKYDKDIRKVTPPYIFGKSPRTQDFEGILIEAGGLYASSRNRIIESRARVSGSINFYEVSPHNIEVDTPQDFRMVEAILNE